MSIIRDITGICFEQGLEWYSTDPDGREIVISYSLVTQFQGNPHECLIFLKGYAKGNKKGNLADLLEKICRANIENFRSDLWHSPTYLDKWATEVEEVYLSDDERAIKEQQV